MVGMSAIGVIDARGRSSRRAHAQVPTRGRGDVHYRASENRGARLVDVTTLGRMAGIAAAAMTLGGS